MVLLTEHLQIATIFFLNPFGGENFSAMEQSILFIHHAKRPSVYYLRQRFTIHNQCIKEHD